MTAEGKNPSIPAAAAVEVVSVGTAAKVMLPLRIEEAQPPASTPADSECAPVVDAASCTNLGSGSVAHPSLCGEPAAIADDCSATVTVTATATATNIVDDGSAGASSCGDGNPTTPATGTEAGQPRRSGRAPKPRRQFDEGDDTPPARRAPRRTARAVASTRPVADGDAAPADDNAGASPMPPGYCRPSLLGHTVAIVGTPGAASESSALVLQRLTPHLVSGDSVSGRVAHVVAPTQGRRVVVGGSGGNDSSGDEAVEALHWHVAFPEVFDGSSGRPCGFDVVVGNPPWKICDVGTTVDPSLVYQVRVVVGLYWVWRGRSPCPRTSAVIGGVNEFSVVFLEVHAPFVSPCDV